MNWDAIGAIGEILGASAVFITLGYLAVQIRQNTRTLKTSALKSVQDLFLLTDHNERYIGYLMKARRNEELTLEERAHMVERLLTILRTFERLWHEHRLGTLSQYQFDQNLDLLRWALSEPAARRMWRHLSQSFDPEFQALVEKEALADDAPMSSMLMALGALGGPPPKTHRQMTHEAG